LSRLTYSPAFEVGVVWSPDGQTVFFGEFKVDGPMEVAGRRADGTGGTTRLARLQVAVFPTSVSPDGAGLVVSLGPYPWTEDIAWVDTAGKAQQPRMLLDEEFRVQNGELSPDGRWLAYESFESGAPEVLVRPFPALDSGRWAVSSSGGTRPAWSRDGKEIFYLDAQGFLNAVAVEPRGEVLNIGRPEVVIKKAYVNPVPPRAYDVSSDGRRFLMLEPVPAPTSAGAGRIVLVQNWFDELRRVAPPRRSSTR
jgi:Tol biopolymer transport system component